MTASQNSPSRHISKVAFFALRRCKQTAFMLDPGRYIYLRRLRVDAKATGHAFTGVLKDYAIRASGDAAKLKPEALEPTLITDH